MLERRDLENHTPLFNTAIYSRNAKIFDKLLSALAPEKRFKHLTAFVGQLDDEMPFIFHLVEKLSNSEKDQRIWESSLAHLTHEEQVRLVMYHDQKGDSFLLHKVRTNARTKLNILLKPLSVEQIKSYFKEVCPHGNTPLIQAVSKWKLKILKSIFGLLDREEWLEIMAYKPEGWSMTHGEKIYVISFALDCSSDNQEAENFECSSFLSNEFGLSLPVNHQSLSQEDLMCELKGISNYERTATCDAKHNFMKKHGQTPEDIFGLETYLMPKTYTVAFRKQQLVIHPDKNNSDDAHERSARLNEAHRFMNDSEVRRSYRTPSILDAKR